LQQAQRPVEAESVTELCELVMSATQAGDHDLLQETIGTIGVLVGTIVRQQNSETLRAMFREIAQTCTVPDTRKVLKAAKIGLAPELAEWLDSQLLQIAQGSTEIAE